MVAAVMTVILLLTAGGGYLWYRMARGQQTEPSVLQDSRTSEPLARPDEPVMATLFLPAGGRLVTTVAAVKRQPDAQLQVRQAIVSVLGGEWSAQATVLKDLRLRALYCDDSGTAYLDLSLASPNLKEIRASAADELLAVYALVNTLTQNFPEVHQVRFLMDGREVQTLAGHIDLARAFVKRMDLVQR